MSTDRRSLLEESLAAIQRLQKRVEAAASARHEPIAIVGAACRYPGGVETPEQLWRLLREGVDAVSEVPVDRWDVDRFHDPNPQAPGKMITRRGGFLRQVDRFDPAAFGISPREAKTLDPQQRLLLETSLEALESAAIAPDTLVGSSTGVFVGITTNDYGELVRAGGVEHSDVYSATGNALNAAAGRIAFTFGFQGPAVAVDTACSSSLVAVHLACRALRDGDADLALAGGVNVVLSPDAMILFSKWGMLAPDGRCKTFDAAADGFVRGEGCAMIALKRLSDAQAAGDPILAIIRGTAVNQDGRSSGLTVPNGLAQQAVLRRALADARVEAGDIDYVEAHGTGTPLGDPIELEALGAVMAAGRDATRPLLVGSVKTNIGHTEAASGLAGLLKVVLSLRHEAIPPHLHFSKPNPGIPWERLPIAVPASLTPWPRAQRPRRAGVSAFGFSGTNAHVIVEEAPAVDDARDVSPANVLVPLSARDDAALRASAEKLAEFLTVNPETRLADVAATMAVGRSHSTRRAAVLASDIRELERTLRALANGENAPGVTVGAIRPGERPKIAFMFTGQGAQYPGMGRVLYEREPVFRAALDRASEIVSPLLGRSLLDVLFPAPGAATPVSETAFTQPALFALEYALAAQWASWGIRPSVVLGHSVGEYVAACVAGVMSLEDGLALIAERGRLMQALPAGGAMAAVFADEARVAPRLDAYRGRLAIAAVNGPEETVISGDADALEEVVAGFVAEGITSRRLDVSHAFHSPRLDPMLDALERRASSMTFAAPRLTLISNLTGAPFAPGVAPDAAYWRRHAREPVRFAASLEALRAAGVTAIVEIGPHPTLLALAARAVKQPTWIGAASLRRDRDDHREMLSALGTLYTRGAAVQWQAVAPEGARRIALPTYPFQRERHWVDEVPRTSRRPIDGHPLLGERRELAHAPGTFVWETEISLETHPWLGDHRVQNAAIVPATAYIEMAFAAAKDVWGDGSLAVEAIENLKPMILHGDASRRVQTTLMVADDGTAWFAVHSRENDAPFIGHATASVRRTEAPAASDAERRAALEAARARCATNVDGGTFYAALARRGNQWGPAFQGVRQLWIGDGEAVGRVDVASSIASETTRYRFHPAVSDSCGHPLVATVPLEGNAGATGGALVGGGVGQVIFHRSPAGKTLWSHAKLRQPLVEGERVVVGDVRVYEESGALVSETLGARLWYLDNDKRSGASDAPDDWFYDVSWTPRARTDATDRATRDGTWIVFADETDLAGRIAALRSNARTVVVTAGSQLSIGDDGRAIVRMDSADDVRRLLEAVPDVGAVIALVRGDRSPVDAAGSVIRLLQSVIAPGSSRRRLWLVTRDAQAVVDRDDVSSPFAAAVWGIGRTIAAERAEVWGGLIDVARTDADAARHVVEEIAFADAEDSIAFRGGQRYVARLERSVHPTATRAVSVRADATYLISGGLGGIGLAMARWLVDRGARHLLLVGRTPLPPRDEWPAIDATTPAGRRIAAIRDIEALGARVDTAAVDVSNRAALEQLINTRQASGQPPVRGVIHAAGTLAFRPIESETDESLRAMFAAKVDGAWALHELFTDAELFVLCSSSSALLKSPLLGAYAGANTFLDALAHHRRARGLAALSVNWGTWGEVGMAVEGSRASGSMLEGMDTIPTAAGLSALARLLAAGATQAAVMPIDWPRLVASYPAFARDPFLSSLASDLTTATPTSSSTGAAVAIRSATGDEQRTMLLSYLRGEAARTLGMSVDGLDPGMPLSSLGFDSLMAVQLKNQIEADLGAVVPMIQFLQGPSVEQLAPMVLTLLSGTQSASTDDDAWEAGSL